MFVFVGLESGLDDFQLSSGLVKGILSPFLLLEPRFELIAELCLKIFLDTHAKDVRVDGQDHLLRHCVQLRLLSLNSLRHLSQS